MKNFALALVAFGIMIAPVSARAHQMSDSYLTISVDGEKVEGKWDISLRDLDYALILDSSQDGNLTWGEVKSRQAEIEKFAFSALVIGDGGQSCAISNVTQALDEHAGENFATLVFKAECPEGVETSTLSYNLLFDLDPSHRGIIKITQDGAETVSVASPENREVSFTPSSVGALFAKFFHMGMHHILEGYDHIMFLLTLVFAAVIGKARRVEKTLPVLWETLKILTAFTVSHAITLSLAQFGIVSLPSRLVETTIAFSIFLTALDNFHPFLGRRVWLVAFCFGLVHGLGFASAMGPVSLSTGNLILALASFNIGVEAGQVLLASLVLIVLMGIIHSSYAWRRRAALAGSAVTASFGLLWFIDRAFDAGFMPF